MGEFKKSGGFDRGGNPRTRRAEQSRRTQWHDEASHDGQKNK